MNRAAPATTGIGTVAENGVVTGCAVVGMGTGPRTVTGVIRTHIPVIGTGGARRIKAAVRCLLAGVALRLGARGSRMQAASAAAGVGTVTVEAVITGCRVSRMCTYSRSVTGIIRAHIEVIGTDRP